MEVDFNIFFVVVVLGIINGADNNIKEQGLCFAVITRHISLARTLPLSYILKTYEQFFFGGGIGVCFVF